MAANAGDTVEIVTREVTAEDAKSGLYYSYFGGLTGRVDRAYPDGSVCVDVDLDSLTEETRARHLAIQEAERKRWLDGLSDEVRNRLTADQKQLKMSYRILVSKQDIESAKGRKPKIPAPDQPSAEVKPEGPKASKEEGTPHRLSEAEIEAAEEAYLHSRQSGSS